MKKISIPIPRIRRRKRQAPASGSAPGTLHLPIDLPAPLMSLTVFGPDDWQQRQIDSSELQAALQQVPGKVVWLDVQGLGDGDLLHRIGEIAGLHPLTVEDIAHVHQRPKVDEFDDHLFITLRMVRLLEDGAIDNEQLSLVIKSGLLMTFQERPGDGFEPVRRRLREGKGPLRRGGAEYLAYALMDTTIDDYYPVVEAYTNTMDMLEDAVRENPTAELSRNIHQIRRELRQFRRAVWPLRDVVGPLGRGGFEQIPESAQPSFRDCYDHVVQAMDIIDGSRERAAELADLHLVMTSERTNQVMKVLTIIATIFIPLTFLCGLYGMNFDVEVSPYNMPELKWRFGYPAFWLVTLAVLVGMIWFFRRKGWIGPKSR
jgi:magnesium transporter